MTSIKGNSHSSFHLIRNETISRHNKYQKERLIKRTDEQAEVKKNKHGYGGYSVRKWNTNPGLRLRQNEKENQHEKTKVTMML